MKKMLILLIAMMLILSSACTGSKIRVLEPSEADYHKVLDTNSPEGIAKATSMIYKDIADGKISVDEAMEKLKGYASSDSFEDILKKDEKFRKGIKDFKEYMESNGDKIVRFEFAKTVYVNPQEAYVERVQQHKNKDKRYFFKQDFLLENGQWRVRGDNATDPFKLKWSISKNHILK